MGRNVSRSNCLPCGVGCETCGNLSVGTRLASGGVSTKRCFADDGHAKRSSPYPLAERFDGFSRSLVFRVPLFKIWKYVFRAVGSPESQCLLVRPEDLMVYSLCEGFVENLRN